MKRISLATVALLCCTMLMGAKNYEKNYEMITGKWKFEDVPQAEKEKMDAQGLKMLEMLFGEMWFYFMESGDCKAFMMGKVTEGTWKLNKNGKVISITTRKGEGFEIDIVKLTSKKMTMKLQGKVFLMSRTAPTKEDGVLSSAPALQKVSVTEKQVARTWYLKSKEPEKKMPGELNGVNSVLKNMSLTFSKNGAYKANVLNIQEEGKWKLGKDRKTIVVTVGREKKIWSVIGISETALVLTRGESTQKWTYSTTPSKKAE